MTMKVTGDKSDHNGTTCLITGAAGFVGSSISDALLAKGFRVIGLDCFVDYYPRTLKENNLRQARAHENYSFIEQDLAKCAVQENGQSVKDENSAGTLNLAQLLSRVDYVFHQAAQAGVRASWGQSFEIYSHNNIVATQRLLEAAKLAAFMAGGTGKARLKKIVYASSSSVYGDAEAFPTKETALPKPISPYGVSKLAAEHLMLLYSKEFDVPTTSLRYFTVFGPRQRPDMAFHRFIRAALSGEELVVYGDGEQSRDFTFISDIVAANISAAELAPSGSVYNLGGGVQASVNQVLEELRSIIGIIKVRHLERQAGDARHTSADCSEARRAIDFSPRVSLRAGLESEVSWIEDLLKNS